MSISYNRMRELAQRNYDRAQARRSMEAEVASIYARIAENDRIYAEQGRQRGARNRQRALAADAVSTGMRGTLLTPLLGMIGQDEQKSSLLGL